MRKFKTIQRPPTPKNEAVTRSMRANKAKGTKPDLLLRSLLRKADILDFVTNCPVILKG